MQHAGAPRGGRRVSLLLLLCTRLAILCDRLLTWPSFFLSPPPGPPGALWFCPMLAGLLLLTRTVRRGLHAIGPAAASRRPRDLGALPEASKVPCKLRYSDPGGPARQRKGFVEGRAWLSVCVIWRGSRCHTSWHRPGTLLLRVLLFCVCSACRACLWEMAGMQRQRVQTTGARRHARVSRQRVRVCCWLGTCERAPAATGDDARLLLLVCSLSSCVCLLMGCAPHTGTPLSRHHRRTAIEQTYTPQPGAESCRRRSRQSRSSRRRRSSSGCLPTPTPRASEFVVMCFAANPHHWRAY